MSKKMSPLDVRTFRNTEIMPMFFDSPLDLNPLGLPHQPGCSPQLRRCNLPEKAGPLGGWMKAVYLFTLQRFEWNQVSAWSVGRIRL